VPISEFADLEAVRFLRDLTYRSLHEYCERLENTLINAYGSDASGIAMLEALSPILSHRLKNNFSAHYWFRTQGPDDGRHWKVRKSVSEVSFISVGTTDRESDLNGIVAGCPIRTVSGSKVSNVAPFWALRPGAWATIFGGGGTLLGRSGYRRSLDRGRH